MKYSPVIYAEALSHALAKSPREEKTIIANFLAAVKKNNDAHLLKKILAETEKRLRALTGKRKVVIETARPYRSLKSKLTRLLRASDIVEEKLNPELIAGVRVSINDEMEFDNSLARKLARLFG